VKAGSSILNACKELEVSVRTYERWKDAPLIGDQRQECQHGVPANKLSSGERKRIIETCTSAEYRDLSPAQIVPKLADIGVFIGSESSCYRILKEEKMLAHRSNVSPVRRKRPHELSARKPNQVWTWDITYLRAQVRGRFYYLYLIVDIFSREIVGWTVSDVESAEISSQLVRETCMRQGVLPAQLSLHSDNGGPMKGATMLVTLQKLGVIPSFSRPSVSNDNPYSEALFRTLKYCPEYPSQPFESVDAVQVWVETFVHWYNTEHLHSGIRFVTPAQKHAGKDVAILENRKKVYEQARKQNPCRWTRSVRNWNPITEVTLNPLKSITKGDMQKAA